MNMPKRKYKKRSKRDLYRKRYDVDFIIAAYQRGESGRKISDKTGNSLRTIQNILHVFDVPIRESNNARSKRMRENASEIIARYKDGESMQPIADDLGTSVSTIGNILKEQGIPSRYHSRAELYPKKYNVDGIVTAYEDLKGLDVISAEFGIAIDTVKNVLKYAGIAIRTCSETIAARKDKELQRTIEVKLEAGLGTVIVKPTQSIQEMRDSNLTLNQIAEIKGLTPMEVGQHLGIRF